MRTYSPLAAVAHGHLYVAGRVAVARRIDLPAVYILDQFTVPISIALPVLDRVKERAGTYTQGALLQPWNEQFTILCTLHML